MKRLINCNLNSNLAKQKLIDGNNRFINNQLNKKDISKKKRFELLNNGQNPFAIIVCCSDSRVPPEIIFDQGLGELFVIRIAGNIIDSSILGSIKYAISKFKCQIIIVLGHDNCGAIEESLKNNTNDKDILSIVNKIKPLIDKNIIEYKQLYNKTINENIYNSVNVILNDKDINNLINENKLIIESARYHLDSGEVEFLKE